MPASDNQYTAFRCPKDLLELARIKGKKDRRSLSNYLVTLIAKDVEGMELPVPITPKSSDARQEETLTIPLMPRLHLYSV